MQFGIYYEIEPGRTAEFKKLVQEMLSKGPPPGIKIISLTPTCDDWGIALVEGDNEDAVFQMSQALRPVLRMHKGAPALPVDKAVKYY